MTTPPVVRSLPLPTGFDPARQLAVGLLLAQLDDQTRRLKTSIETFGVEHLEWQPRPGHNTAGMLLAHMAVAEAYWMLVSSGEYAMLPDETTAEGMWKRMAPRFPSLVGIGWEDDGLPQKPDGAHPATLAGKPLPFYFDLLDRARAHTRERLLAWSDARLGETYQIGERTISLGWTIYHVLEHFCGHFGQILLQRHLMRDAGIWSGETD